MQGNLLLLFMAFLFGMAVGGLTEKAVQAFCGDIEEGTPSASHNNARDADWRCGTKDCVCNEGGICDCHSFTVPPTSPVA